MSSDADDPRRRGLTNLGRTVAGQSAEGRPNQPGRPSLIQSASGYRVPSTPLTMEKRAELIGKVQTRGWMTIRDFATAVADVSYLTALRWVGLEMIRVVKVGGANRIYEDEVVRFLREGTLPPDPEKYEAYREKHRPYEQEYQKRTAKRQGKYNQRYRNRERPKS